ncbi:MAG TPA: glycosyltransferase family 39 protein [Ktedonobacteraceae bacterium]|nr:glycosyltransferase family 39 protein [Ktedonobacteraceae bacterium]
MRIATPTSHSSRLHEPASAPLSRLRTLLLSWELYLVIGIVLLAGFLRLYRIDSSTLDVDQTMIYRMARDAITHGHLVATSNASSIGNTNPPGAVYLMMLPAAFTADPLWGTILLAVLSTLSVLLAYLFTRRYYGLLAGCTAALLYAVSQRSVAYARYIWQPNLMPFFVMLFIWLLFRGVIERKRGWFAPALLLAGFIFQLHTTAVLLIAPLFVAILLAPGTIRKRDIVLGILGLLLVYAPYIAWEFSVHFQDIRELFSSGKTQAHIDSQALYWYRTYIDPYDGVKPNPGTILSRLTWLLDWVTPVMYLLLTGAMLFAVGRGLWSRRTEKDASAPSLWHKGWDWWLRLRASPYRCGLLVLFTWQIIPLVAFTRHSLPIFRHYVMFTMPGQFILIGLFIALIAHWFQARGGIWQTGRFYSYFIIIMLILSQGVGTFAMDLDQARGNYRDLYSPTLYHSDIGSMHNALNLANRYVQQMHLNRLYVTTDVTQNGMGYLAEQLSTPVTTFDDSRCLVLPAPASGPAIMLVGPHSAMANALLAHFAHATLLAQPKHLGGPPYSIYLVNPDTTSGSYQDAFPQNLQLLDTGAQKMQLDQQTFLVTDWNLLRASTPSYRKTYTYNMSAQATGAQSWTSGGTCTFNAIRPGDHLLVAMRAVNDYVPTSISVKSQYYVVTPHLLNVGPIIFETGKDDSTPWSYISVQGGKESLTVPVA